MSPYGDFGVVLKTVVDAISASPYLLGNTISAADILWGNALGWGTAFGLVPTSPAVTEYIARILRRPAALTVAVKDTDRAAAHVASMAPAP